MDAAMGKAKEIYVEMKDLYLVGNENPDNYLAVAKKYAKLVDRHGNYRDGLHTEWTIDGTTFRSSRGTSTYTSYKSFTRLPDFLMFAEDCAMMIYRLHGGQGYTTMDLVKILEEEERAE